MRRLDENDDAEDVQAVVAPSYRTAQRSQHESDLSSIQAAAYRKAQMSEHSEDDLQRTLSSSGNRYQYPSTGSARVSASQSHQSESSRISSARTAEYDADEQSRVQPTHRVTAVVRPGQNVRIAYVPGQGVASTRIDSASAGSETSSHYVQPDTQTYRVYYKPAYNTYDPSSSSYQAASSNTEAERRSSSSTASRLNSVQQRPEKLTNYDSFHNSRASQSRVQTEEEEFDTQQRVTPSPVNQPTNGGSSRYSSQSQTQNSSSRYASSRPVSYSVNSHRAANSGNYLTSKIILSQNS